MNILKVLLLLVTGSAALVGFELSAHVHSARWKVKTLADSFIVPTSAIPTTIAKQVALVTPNVGESVTRLPSERTLYNLHARLVEVKEELDGDYHLVIEDPRTKLRMIAEIPDTNASEPRAYRRDYAEARQEINRIAGRPGFFARRLGALPMIEIEGIGFFDEPHFLTPDGMAQNDREIHPVLKIEAVR